MHLSIWKPIITQCASTLMILDKKIKRSGKSSSGSTLVRKSQETKLKEALQEASENGLLAKSQTFTSTKISSSRYQVLEEFLRATLPATEMPFCSEVSIPDLHCAYIKFLAMYPKFKSTERIDQLRVDEYNHLNESKVCLDYCGFGLFSYLQIQKSPESSQLSVREVSVNLSNHALHGVTETGSVEHDMKTRVLDYLNIPENEYCIVFTINRGSAFQLLAESYPFRSSKSLLTMYDHESESVNLMAKCAQDNGAKIYSASFEHPTLKPCYKDLRKRISTGSGLFVFPVQSRVSGTKYSYEWIALAQQKKWHVLLDAGSVGPKEMDALGVSFFRPDFIITSFYKVFGFDSSGFGCLLIKKSVITSLRTGNGHIGSGIVRILPVSPLYLTDSFDDEFEIEMDHEISSENDAASTSFEDADLSSEDESSDNSYWIGSGQSKRVSPKQKKVYENPIYDHDSIKHHVNVAGMSHEPSRGRALGREDSRERAIRREIGSDLRSLDLRDLTCRFIGMKQDSSSNSSGMALVNSHGENEFDDEIICRNLDQVDSLGLNKTTLRLRYLTNWLVTSLLQLQFPSGVPLVEIYGPKINYERGASVAFNVRECDQGARVIHPDFVQKLAERNGICLGVAILSHLKNFQQIADSSKHPCEGLGITDTALCKPMVNTHQEGKITFYRMEVVTVSLGFLTNFEDVFKLWAFVARFLNSYIVKEGLEK